MQQNESPQLQINLELHANPKATETEKFYLSAIQSMYYARAIFWLLCKFSDASQLGYENFEKNELTEKLVLISEIGLAFVDKALDSADLYSLAVRKDGQNV